MGRWRGTWGARSFWYKKVNDLNVHYSAIIRCKKQKMDYDLPALREQIISAFNDNELRDICFEMRVDYEIVDGTNKSAKARELITFLRRRGRIPELILICQKQRPSMEWNLVLSQNRQNEEFRKQLNLLPSQGRYLDLRFEAYRNVWQKLWELKVAGDELWSRVSKENLLNFATIYQQTRAVVMINAILFTPEDFDRLQTILGTFGRFEAGKLTLARYRATDSEHEDTLSMRRDGWTYDRIRRQIDHNRKEKDAYDSLLLDTILVDFRSRIAELIA